MSSVKNNVIIEVYTMKILVTGGCGYIGSHLTIELLKLRNEVIVVDNLSNSNNDILNIISSLGGSKVVFYNVDLRDYESLEDVFDQNRDIDYVFHLAEHKSIEESVRFPLKYYDNNVRGTLNLLAFMTRYSLPNIIFGSSACANGITNPYGNTKFAIERLISDWVNADDSRCACILRIYNACGYHVSGRLMPSGYNLFPMICSVVKEKSDSLTIYGDDFDTPDGTQVRDFIHIDDVVDAYVCAMNIGFDIGKTNTYDIGTGIGHSVREVISEFEKQLGKTIKVNIEKRRPYDISKSISSAGSIKKLDWKAKNSLETMVSSTITAMKIRK